MIAPGVEDAEGHDREFLVRAGLAYDFEFGSLTIAPTLNVDFVDDEEIFVFGVTLGRGF